MHETKILAALRENYKSCVSYEDQGTVQLTLTLKESVEELVSEFSTIFIRPNLLKFDIKNRIGQVVLQANGESIRELHYRGNQPPDSISVYPNLPQAIGALEGVSQGVLSVVFGLLEDFKSPSFYDKLDNLKRLPDVVIDDLECHCISGQYNPYVTVTIWASKETNVLRRVEKVISEEVSREAIEMTRSFEESEGIPKTETGTFSTISTVDFKQVTFNNSITIDAIG